MENNSYNTRIVTYENIHSIDPEDFKKFIETINPQNDQIILDACCGYGSVTKNLNEQINQKKLNTKIYAVDNSELQISRAKENIDSPNTTIIQSDVMNMPFEKDFFDTVVIKMGLHEVNKEMQAKMIQELTRVLKPGGKLVIWELALSEKTQPIFSRFIKEKDTIGEFTSLVSNRYFPKKDEILTLLEKAGLQNPELVHDIYPNLSIQNRKSELVSALRGEMTKNGVLDEILLEEIAKKRTELLMNFAKNLTNEEKGIMHYQEVKNENEEITDIIMSAEKGIFTATKKT